MRQESEKVVWEQRDESGKRTGRLRAQVSQETEQEDVDQRNETGNRTEGFRKGR
jgi:hypothetical protein